MKTKSIKDWLNGDRSFGVGAALYLVHGKDDLLKKMFTQGASEYRQKRLEAALRKLIESNTETALVETAPAPITVAVREEIMPENQIKETEDPYRKEWLPLYQRMNYLRHQLQSAENDEVRGNMAHEILSLERQCYRIWYHRDYFLKYKEHLPEEKTEEPVTDRNQLHRQLCNIRSNITKAKKKLSTNPDDEKARERKAKYEAEAKRIEKLLENYA